MIFAGAALFKARPVPRRRIGSKRAGNFIAESGFSGKFWARNAKKAPTG
jgi:hypothetical protein